MKRLLVTGLDGFVGTHLRQMLEVGAVSGDFELVVPATTLELRDRASIDAVVRETRPDAVLHLAAQAFVPLAVKEPLSTYEINFLGTQHLLASLEEVGFGGRFLYVSSGDVYGQVAESALPITELCPPRPRNPYAVSKAAAELLCCQWAANGMDVIVVRPFNHVGPGQSDYYVLSDWAKQVTEIRLKRREPRMMVGSIDVTRDFTDVRDVIQAYFLLLEKGCAGEIYNVASGNEYRLSDLLHKLLELAGVDCDIHTDMSRIRPNEQKRVCGSALKLCGETGWKPARKMEDTLQDILDAWKEKLKNA